MWSRGTSSRFCSAWSVVTRVPSAAKIFDDCASPPSTGVTVRGVYAHAPATSATPANTAAAIPRIVQL